MYQIACLNASSVGQGDARNYSSIEEVQDQHQLDPDEIRVDVEVSLRTGYRRRRRHSDDSSLDETDLDLLIDADEEKDVFRTKKFLVVSDLARKSPLVLARKSNLYHWNLLTMAVFYGLPVVQLMLTYQNVTNVTGNQDLCYYNFLCAHPLGIFTDFNHVFSNIGYVLLGALFIGIVYRRDVLHRRFVEYLGIGIDTWPIPINYL